MNARRTAAWALLALLLGVVPAAAQQPAPADAGWQTFEGSWWVTGRRQELPTEGARPAAVLDVSGTVVLARGDGLARGFRGEAIAFDDGRSLAAGRCVFTDDKGDRIYATLTGDAPGPTRRVTGTITGGTGRYAGLTGTFTFDWQYIVHAADGLIEGRTTNLAGRCRKSAADVR